MQLSVILNSTRGNAEAIAARLDEAVRNRSAELHVDICRGSELVRATRRALDRGSTAVVAGGGDGTISTVASVVAGSNAVLGVLPLGTLNHFARDLQIPRGLDEAIATVLDGQVIEVDVGEVNGRLFINNASVGLYPRLVWERERRQRDGHRKWIAMAAAAWTVWRRYRRVTVTIQHGDRSTITHLRTPFVFIGNNRYELTGLDFGSRATLSGKRLHVCMAPELGAAGVLGVLGAVLAGRLDSFERFEAIDATDLTIAARRPRLGVALDGELVVMPTPLRCRIRPAALRVTVPRSAG